jgi:alkanesulfonate monooxygenase SsuD/methylene tetrahydromethanopterin reductase-like flavin-dependent oxidoreductase (luciferase family)
MVEVDVSQSLEIQLVLSSFEALAEAIAELRAALRQESRLETRDGRTHRVDYVVTDEEGTQVGIRIDPKTQRAVLVSDGCGSRAQALAGRIAQRYAYARVTDELRRKGYRVTREQRGADGAIQLVATRWA